jgi:hypothetical protein
MSGKTKGFKTVAFGVLLAALAVFSNAEMQQFVAEHLPEVGGFVGTIVVILRALTNSPIGKKEDDNRGT